MQPVNSTQSEHLVVYGLSKGIIISWAVGLLLTKHIQFGAEYGHRLENNGWCRDVTHAVSMAKLTEVVVPGVAILALRGSAHLPTDPKTSRDGGVVVLFYKGVSHI